MSSFVNGRRVATVILLILAVLAIYTTLGNSRQFAQRNAGKTQPRSGKYFGADEITDDIRSESKEIARLKVSDQADRETAARYGRIVADYGSFVVVAKNKGAMLYQSGLDSQSIDTTISLPGAKFEPVSDPPSSSLRLGEAATTKGKGYYIIQFGSTVKDDWLESLEAVGIEVLQYVPNQAYLVYGDGEAIAAAADNSRVRWIGSYTADEKLSPVTRDQVASALNKTPLKKGIPSLKLSADNTATFNIYVFSRADLDSVAGAVKAAYSKGNVVTSRLQSNYFNVIRAELRPEEVATIAEMPDVVSIEAYFKPQTEDERSSQIIAGNYSSPTSVNGPGYNPKAQFGVDGTNVTVAVVDDGVGIPGDGGLYMTAANAVNGPLHGASSGAEGHGHLNATIIAGTASPAGFDSLGYIYGMGVAPKANIVNIPWLRIGYTGTEVDLYRDSVSTAGPNFVHPIIANNSWGNQTNGNTYNMYAAEFDGFVRDAIPGDSAVDPICLIFSAGNNGALGLTQPKIAKNVIAVGSSEGLRTDIAGFAANNIDDMASDSSQGPAADGRIKPDITAPGTGITGGRSGPDSLLGNIDANHRWSSGTSHAAPQISGMAALFTQWWIENNFGAKPTPALIRAAIINTAQDMNGNLSSAPVPNGNEGWGRANMKLLLNTGVGMQYINQQITLNNTGDMYGFFAGSVADSNKPIRVTLAWTDPPGIADPALVNNLDLVVTIGSTQYKGNVLSNGFSVPGGTADTVNNVETVILPAGIPSGTYFSVQVIPTALNGDGVINNADPTDQNYAIVAYNYSSVQAPSFYTVSGRVSSPSGRGVALARVFITDPQGQVRSTVTNHLGYFSFEHTAGGQTHTMTVASKRCTFLPQGVAVNSNLSNVSFVAVSGSP